MFASDIRFRWLALVVAAVIVLASSCGDEGHNPETVHLHVFNAYAGSNSADVIGPSGIIASDVAFGERTEEPVAVDRSLESDLTILLEGIPVEFEGDPGLYSLYPQETATLVIGHREEESLEVGLLRHIQSGSTSCRLVVNNLLSLQSEGLGLYNFIVGWNMEDEFVAAGYNEPFEQQELDQEDHRPGLYDEMEEHPYFAFFTGGDADNAGMVWLGPEDEIDPPRVDFESGNIQAPPTTEDYIACIEERNALEEQLEQAADDDEEDVDFAQLEEIDCQEPLAYNAALHEPDAGSSYTFHYPPTMGVDDETCDHNHQIYADFNNIFEGEHGPDNAERLRHTTDFEVADHYFLNVYGRPVNPLLETWRASDHFTDLPDYPAGAGETEDE